LPFDFLFDIYQTFWYNTPEARRLPEQGYLTTEEKNIEYNRPAHRAVLTFAFLLFPLSLISL
jgi:hypothetical protein